ncbi:MAG TPA: DNA-directed RNA polymerase subunit omega [Exilispira sp.]|nr:DNA-directed RNA polymerase subunit omega [Exilispira sp.]
MKEKFPLYEIINYKGNRYELARACSLRAYHLILKKKEEQKGLESNITSSNKYNSKKDLKIQAIAMAEVLKNKIKFYNADNEKNK